MEFRFVPRTLHSLDDVSAEVIACSMWSDVRPMGGLAGLLDWRSAGKISRLARSEFVRGDVGEVLFVPGRPRLPFDKVLVFGAGSRATFSDDVLRDVIMKLLRTLEGLHVRRAVVELPGRADGLVEPERAAEIVLASAGDSTDHDAWWLVEETDAQARISARALDERRRSRTA